MFVLLFRTLPYCTRGFLYGICGIPRYIQIPRCLRQTCGANLYLCTPHLWQVRCDRWQVRYSTKSPAVWPVLHPSHLNTRKHLRTAWTYWRTVSQAHHETTTVRQLRTQATMFSMPGAERKDRTNGLHKMQPLRGVIARNGTCKYIYQIVAAICLLKYILASAPSNTPAKDDNGAERPKRWAWSSGKYTALTDYNDW